jgi:hypothetical protein
MVTLLITPAEAEVPKDKLANPKQHAIAVWRYQLSPEIISGIPFESMWNQFTSGLTHFN